MIAAFTKYTLTGGIALMKVLPMIVELERRVLISRVPGQPRTVRVTFPDDEVPRLQPAKISATRY